MLKKSPQYAQLKEAMELINELKIPEHLQEKALSHLLQSSNSKPSASAAANEPMAKNSDTSGSLRDFIEKSGAKGAVAEIPALLYWAKKQENTTECNEAGIVELYRRAGIKPPKHVNQSMRDLASKKKYGRLNAVSGKPGYVALSRPGEDFVLHDLLNPRAK